MVLNAASVHKRIDMQDEEPGQVPFNPAAVARDRETAPAEATRSILARGREGKMEILCFNGEGKLNLAALVDQTSNSVLVIFGLEAGIDSRLGLRLEVLQ